VPVTADEVRSGAQWWTYRSTKAKKELGFKPRPHEETLEDAVQWQVEHLGDRVGRAPRTDIVLRVFGRLLQAGERVGVR
jgi:dihydroflavonol-4-reductase